MKPVLKSPAPVAVVVVAVGIKPVTTPWYTKGLPEFPAALFYFSLPAPVVQRRYL